MTSEALGAKGIWTPSAPNLSREQADEAIGVIAQNRAIRDGLVRSFTVNGVDWYFTPFRPGSIFVNEHGEPQP